MEAPSVDVKLEAYKYAAAGYDDGVFQEAMRGKSEKDFFANFKLFTPEERVLVGSTWVVHTMFDIQERKRDPLHRAGEMMDHVTHQGHEHFASVPSKLVVASDGPLQILGLDVERRIEIIVQVATPHHFPNACIAVELGTSKLADRYPANIDERRRCYTEMMQTTTRLAVNQSIGSNPAQLVVLAEWPPHLVPVTGLGRVALLALRFGLKFEGYSGVFEFKSLLAAKVLDTASMTSRETKIFAKAMQAYENVLPKASYRLTTDEPPKMHRGVLLVELLGGSAIPKAGIGPQPTGAKPDSFCELTVEHRGVKMDAQQSAVARRTSSPRWAQTFKFMVPNGKRDVLHVKVMDKDMLLKDHCVGTVTVAIVDVAGDSEAENCIERDWRIDTPPSVHATAGAGLRIKLNWRKTPTGPADDDEWGELHGYESD